MDDVGSFPSMSLSRLLQSRPVECRDMNRLRSFCRGKLIWHLIDPQGNTVAVLNPCPHQQLVTLLLSSFRNRPLKPIAWRVVSGRDPQNLGDITRAAVDGADFASRPLGKAFIQRSG